MGKNKLKRALSLPLVVLYGLGGTVGAGIYVLVGVAAERAGVHAPLAFLLAAFVMSFTAASFAELSVRFPVTAGEAAYVLHGFRSERLALVIGLMVVSAGVVSAATVAVGSAGYIMNFVTLPQPILVTLAVFALGAVVCWGITESVVLASLLTVIEVLALIVLIAYGFAGAETVVPRLPEILPVTSDFAIWSGVLSAGLLAFFAFIGFEDIVNVAEEAKSPATTLPRAIALTLIISTVLYLLVASVAVLAVPPPELAASRSPLATVFGRVTGFSPSAMSAVAIIATLNGMIIQMIMASRVLYGLGRQGQLPAWLADVHPLTRTPLYATLVIIAIVYALAMLFPIETLAEWTSQITLIIFTVVNLALIKLKLEEKTDPESDQAFQVPIAVPVLGVVSSIGLLLTGFI